MTGSRVVSQSITKFIITRQNLSSQTKFIPSQIKLIPSQTKLIPSQTFSIFRNVGRLWRQISIWLDAWSVSQINDANWTALNYQLPKSLFDFKQFVKKIRENTNATPIKWSKLLLIQYRLIKLISIYFAKEGAKNMHW